MTTTHPTKKINAQAIHDIDAALVAPAYYRYSHVVVERAAGAHLYTADGRDILDFGCGISVTNLGHNHPAVVEAVHRQIDRLWHTSVTAIHPLLAETAQALLRIAPPNLEQVFFCNTGAEAVEGAIKLARKATGRSDIIAFTGAFHGRTYGALSLTTSHAQYREGIGPFLPGVHHVPYPYCFHTCTHTTGEPCAIAQGSAIEELLATCVSPSNVAAIVVEPILGEGGYFVPPDDFLPALRRICTKHGIMLIADEVQSGMGRSGTMFAVQHTGVAPDIMCVAKALANGLPLGAILASTETMSAWHPGDHGTTFGGNPLSCAAAIATIETLEADNVPARAGKLGADILSRAQSWKEQFPALGDVRGRGFMTGLEFVTEGSKPAPQLVAAIRQSALQRGLLLLSCGVYDNVIRLVPPLTIPEDELHAGLDILEASITEICA